MKDRPYILVTGGAGFIGSHTVVALIEQGFIPVIADDFRNSDRQVLEGIKAITGVQTRCEAIDVSDFEALEAIFKKYNFSGIIHFAAYKAVGESVKSPLKYYKNNVSSLISCLELAEKYRVKNFVFSSSCTVYGDPDTVTVSETSPIKKANSPYGATKQVCEQIIEDLHRSGSQLRVLNLRYFNPVGAHPSGLIGELPIGTPTNLFPFITQSAIGKLPPILVHGNDYATPDGTCVRDYIHVMDLAVAHTKGLQWLDSHDQAVCEVVNVGTGQGASVLEIIYTFEEITGGLLKWQFGPRRPGDVPQIYADATKALEMLGWNAEYSIKDAVRDAWNWEQKLAHAH